MCSFCTFTHTYTHSHTVRRKRGEGGGDSAFLPLLPRCRVGSDGAAAPVSRFQLDSGPHCVLSIAFHSLPPFFRMSVCQDATFALYLLPQEKSASHKQTKQDKWASEFHKATSFACCQSALSPLHHFLDSGWFHL